MEVTPLTVWCWFKVNIKAWKIVTSIDNEKRVSKEAFRIKLGSNLKITDMHTAEYSKTECLGTYHILSVVYFMNGSYNTI